VPVRPGRGPPGPDRRQLARGPRHHRSKSTEAGDDIDTDTDTDDIDIDADIDKRDPLVGIAVDGKWLRGSACTEPDQVKLFSGMLHHTGVVIGQTQIGDDDSTCELNSMRPLLKRLGDLRGKVITADALHCQRDHAEAIVDDHHGHYLLGVKS
jgi:hypothetical protein